MALRIMSEYLCQRARLRFVLQALLICALMALLAACGPPASGDRGRN